MSAIHGKSLIAGKPAGDSNERFSAFNPSLGSEITPEFHGASAAEIDGAMAQALEAFEAFRKIPAERRADFLDATADEIEALGDVLITRSREETGLPEARMIGERGRTTGQLRLFARVVREGSWVDARIDTALPERTPLPRPDLRRMLIPIGPVVVFGASNFPLAFSVAGGDTASALASGNPVIVKAHRAHPGTSELVASAIAKAIEKTDMPAGVFSLIQGTGRRVGTALVEHPATRAVGFTGSLAGGRALFDAAARRPEPIPVYAEMGSINPVFVLPGALAERGKAIAAGLQQSVCLGVGQFCTNPGLVVGLEDSDLSAFITELSLNMGKAQPATMLHPGIRDAYEAGLERLRSVSGVEVAAESATAPDPKKTQARATVFSTGAATFLENKALSEEVFGPATLVVRCDSRDKLEKIARGLSAHLTATIHATEDDLAEHRDLIAIIEDRVGRLVYNGFPTGVEVCAAMNHGGPYPATTDVHFTSVGTTAMLRFARPICYQSFPQSALPVELRDQNERGIWRMVNDAMSREPIA